MTISWISFGIVCPLVFLAGFVDAVAGGGGLISLPAYLIAGFPAHMAIGTNKLSSFMGTSLTTYKYAKKGYVKWKIGAFCIAAALAGSALGANLALLLDDRVFRILMLVILPLTALYVFKGKGFGEEKEPFGFRKTLLISLGVAFVIGIYDGFYGPGTGTFLILLLTGIGHLTVKEANGIAKVINLSTNVAAMVVYLFSGNCIWALGLTAGVFGILGNYLGARYFEKGGAKSLKPIILVVLGIFFIRVLWEVAFQGQPKQEEVQVVETMQESNHLESEETTSVEETDEVKAIDREEIIEKEASEEDEEYANFAIADVDHYVNVRSQPNTDGEIVGKMYDGSVAEIVEVVGENQEWFKVISGSVEGYIKAEFFISGKDAEAVIDEYVLRYATVIADRLNVRAEPSIESKRIGYIDCGERVLITQPGEEWIKVQYTDSKEGYVAAEYVTLEEEFIYAKSIEEEKAELERQRTLRQREKEPVTGEERPEIVAPVPTTDYENVSDLRKSIVDYASQFLGTRYIHGGQSLEGGTDCSGFTCYVYRAFGYSISRTPSGQFNGAGRSVDLAAIAPGDIICYGSGKSCSHVGLYIGNGQIIHEANSRKGCIISDLHYMKVIGARSVVD